MRHEENTVVRTGSGPDPRGSNRKLSSTCERAETSLSPMGLQRKVKYFHPCTDNDGKRLSTANIIWAERDRGSAYYRTSKYAMKAGVFPSEHPCAPFDDEPPKNSGQMGGSKKLTAFRARGYWASCFPEGDGITLYWWEDVPQPSDKTAAQVMQDIRECFGWEVTDGREDSVW